YAEYLRMLSGVFSACAVALEPGGRIAVNVANLGRKPYRSLSADVIRILEEDVGLLLRGEIIWQKAKGAAGNCAWGTYQRPGDPVIRDLTERVVVASKGRFDRAIPAVERAAKGYPSEATIFRDEFLEATVDIWQIPPESATRVGHPAPFPVELPQRFIDLYTYREDLVLDPFMGSGTTAVAALRTGRHFLGYDTDPRYVAAARERLAAERARLESEVDRADYLGRPLLPAVRVPEARAPASGSLAIGANVDGEDDYRLRGVREGRRAHELARWALQQSGFAITAEGRRLEGGVEVDFVAQDPAGGRWLFDLSGAFTSTPAGLQRADSVWRALGRAAVVHGTQAGARYVLLTTDKPDARSALAKALDALTGTGKPIKDVISLRVFADLERLRRLAHSGR
ncbi:MAG TPA: site-specific DNA-methyltransferase, partial [Acidimicrobiales bacterium]|nr:site-specific DNA-methyltransferase [Acidimicrobiales bacterium]